MLKSLFSILATAFFAFMAMGCNPITRLNVTVELEESFRQHLQSIGGRNIVVDVVAISPNEHQRWVDYSMTKYWEANDPLRASKVNSIKTLSFDPSNPQTQSQTITKSDPIWEKWLTGANDKAPPKLYLLAQLWKDVGWSAADDRPGDADPRRQILPLGINRWATTDVKVQVTRGAIITITQPKRDKPGS